VDERFKWLKKDKTKSILFWQFIEDERNNVVKEYLFGAGQDATAFTDRLPVYGPVEDGAVQRA
jgi:hypothetical protein